MKNKELRPSNIDYNNRGIVRYDLKDYTSAILDYDKAIELSPKDGDAYFNRGLCKYMLKDYKGAISNLKKAIKLKQKNDIDYFNSNITKYNLNN